MFLDILGHGLTVTAGGDVFLDGALLNTSIAGPTSTYYVGVGDSPPSTTSTA